MPNTVYLFDCDNTLLDNDAFRADLHTRLQQGLGAEGTTQYWTAFEALRTELGYADYLGALNRCRDGNRNEPALQELSAFMLDYPFESLLYPQALDVVRQLGQRGTTVILSDGDVVFQPRKLHCAGIHDAVDGRVLIYIHKELVLDEVERLYPADHYVMVDDKLRVLSAMKQIWGDRLTTVFPRQGHYAHDPLQVDGMPAADVTVERVGELATFPRDARGSPGILG